VLISWASSLAFVRAAWISAFVGPPGAPGAAATGEAQRPARTTAPAKGAINPLNLTDNTH